MKKKLQLYIHIPFCAKKCDYCDFLSWFAKEEEQRKYVEALIREIEIRSKAYKEYRVATVFVGGGTPSILLPKQMASILAAMYGHFQIEAKAEITLEVNPGTVTPDKLKVWFTSGINRLSIGLQSANDRELALLGRIHTWSDFVETYELARKSGFENINVDLMSAIPEQTPLSWKNSLQAVTRLAPEHISAYSLILEEGTLFYHRYKGKTGKETLLPEEEQELIIDKLTKDVLAQYGYVRYEISNYSKEGYACLHNVGYWDRREYLGLGLGAASLVGRRRFRNTANMEEYLEIASSSGEFSKDVEALSLSDEMEEHMFLGLRKVTGISRKAFKKYFGRDIEEIYGPTIEKLCKQEVLYAFGDDIRLTSRGMDVSNTVLVQFMEPSL